MTEQIIPWDFRMVEKRNNQQANPVGMTIWQRKNKQLNKSRRDDHLVAKKVGKEKLIP